MRAIRFELRAELRRRWRGWLALAVVAGVLGGLVAAAIAAAERTDSVVARYRAASLATDVIVGNGVDFANPDDPLDQGVDLARVRRLPQVAAAIRGMPLASDRTTPDGRDVSTSVAIEVNPGARGTEAIDRWRILAGRRPAPDRPEEALADATAMKTLGIGLGETFPMRLYLGRKYRPGPRVNVRVVGVRADLLNDGRHHWVTVSPAFYRAYGGRDLALAARRYAIKVHLRGGSADLPAFQRATERIAGGKDFQFTAQDDWAAKLQAGFHLQAQALWIAAGLGAGALLLLLAQGLARTVELESHRHPTLLTLGMTTRQLAGLVVGRVALIAGTAALVTVPVAIALSPLAPFGRAGDYEPRPGIAIDASAIAAGAGVVLLSALLTGAVTAARALRVTAGAAPGNAPIRASAPADALGRAGAGPALVWGVRMAIPGARGATASTTRATLFGAVLAVAAAATALTVAASLTHLLGTPRLFGQTWDFASEQGDELIAEDLARVRADPAIAAAAVGQDSVLLVGGRGVGVAAYDAFKRTVAPTTVAGRAPVRDDELLLGTKTFDALGVDLGDRVPVRRGQRTVRMTVVGRGVIPETAFLSLGEGAAMTLAALRRVVPDARARRLLFRFADGADREAVLRRLEEYWGPPAILPSGVRDVRAVRRVPLAFAVIVALMAAATLARTLVVSIRLRRRELAILKTLGFTRGQVRAAVAWQSTTVGAIAVLAGVPLGLGVGRWIWNLVAGHLGVAPVAITPVAALVLITPAVLLLVNLIAAVPGRLAARTRPAVVLRAE